MCAHRGEHKLLQSAASRLNAVFLLQMREPPKIVTCSNAGTGRSFPVQMVIKPVPALADWFAAGPAPVLVAMLADANAWHAVFVALHGLRHNMVSRSAALEAVVPFDTRDGDFLFLDVHKLQHVGVQQISVRGVIDACPMIHG